MVNLGIGRAPVAINCGLLSMLMVFNVLAQLQQFALVTAGENRKAAPGFGIEVLIVEVKRGGVAFPFPLVSAPQPEKPLYPDHQLKLLGHREVKQDRPEHRGASGQNQQQLEWSHDCTNSLEKRVFLLCG